MKVLKAIFSVLNEYSTEYFEFSGHFDALHVSTISKISFLFHVICACAWLCDS